MLLLNPLTAIVCVPALSVAKLTLPVAVPSTVYAAVPLNVSPLTKSGAEYVNVGALPPYVIDLLAAVIVNGETFKEPFIDLEKVHTDDFSIKDLGYDVIPEDMYLVLGDNRENSLDSRNYGLVSKKQIVGKAWMRIWPFSGIKMF